MQVGDRLDARVADGRERLIRELRLDGDHDTGRGFPGRVGNQMQMEIARRMHHGIVKADCTIC